MILWRQDWFVIDRSEWLAKGHLPVPGRQRARAIRERGGGGSKQTT